LFKHRDVERKKKRKRRKECSQENNSSRIKSQANTKYFIHAASHMISLEEGQFLVNVSLVIQEVVITDCEVYHTGVKKGTASFAIVIKVHWGMLRVG